MTAPIRRPALDLLVAGAVLVGALAVLLFPTAPPGAAQTNEVDRIAAENVALGSGCNPIGLAVEGPTPPIAPTQEWIDEHMACFGDIVQTAAQCQGTLSGDRRYELCALMVVQGDDSVTIDCRDMQMYTEFGLYGPDTQKTNEAIPVFEAAFSGRNLEGAAELFAPCTESPSLTGGHAIVAVFDLDRTEGDVVFRSRVGEGPAAQVAFIVTDQRLES